ncbi:UDP-glucose/GDP-mannose dehydrogenase family protein [Myxococcus stipitatus]|uniref:UDP-glucose dehydrogenase family protein n=1 Tax=Myxococcus stipitatus TaxID=83455 RepID=UPI001F2457C3|nr:UDP-glucose/GDP-mannose dehydrogenase family protein [Myxococcus stipitatus]MCE9670737.1 UDP-glucose/GDP-mannose dehydrogenase family protein [Myxococcus stipitatus]
MRIAVIGTGYVGLVAGTCLAESGHDVTCVDVDARKVASLQEGALPIYEPGLEELVRRNARARRLHFSDDVAGAVSPSQVVFIAVGTPPGERGNADLQYVLAAAEQVGRALRHYTVIVDKSTVPVGTAERVREVVRRQTDVEFDVVSNPEFLKEGAALDDFLKPDRVVIGTCSERARKMMADLYAPFVRTENPILFMDPASAELTKYAANAMLALRISFMNDMATLCERVGANVDLVRKGLGADRRIGYAFLHPGVGYGGSCFPKDVRALICTARDAGLELDLLRAVETTNFRQKRLLLAKALKHYGELCDRTFAVWGLAFKPKTDDMREAPSVELIEGLLGKGARVQCHDPVAAPAARSYFGDRVVYAPTCYEAAEGTDGIFLVTEWNEFRRPDLKRLRKLMRQPVIFDGRNVLDPQLARSEGFTYIGVGRD